MTDWFHDSASGVDVHTPISFTFADQTERESATNPNTGVAYTSDELYRFGRQSDDNSLWMLISTTPTWAGISESTGAGSGMTLTSGDLDFGGTVTKDGILTPDADGDHTVNLGASTSSRIDTFNAFTENFAGIQSGSTNDRSFVAVFGDTLGGMQLGYFQNETSLMGFNINLVKDGDFEVEDAINSKGLVYANDYSANQDARSLVDQGYVLGLVGVGSIYEANGTLSSARTVTGNTGDSLTFEHYNGTSSTYTLRTEVELDDDNVTILAALGDGFGADLASTSVTLANTGLSIATEVGDTDVYLHNNDWVFYEGANDTTTNLLTVHGDGSHSLFDPFITLHEGFATGNGTDSQALIVNFGKANKVQWNDGTRSVDVFAIESIVNASQVFQRMETFFGGIEHRYTGLDNFSWYFESSPGTGQWTVYDDAAGSNVILTLDNAGEFSVAGDVKANGETLVYPFPSNISGAATNQTVTTSDQVITLDTTNVDGSGGEYTIDLVSNHIEMDNADGARIYEINWQARFLLEGQGSGGATRSYAIFKARLDDVDVTWSEQWTYIREYQGGVNGIPNEGFAGSFLIQPAANDELDFVISGATDAGQTITDFELDNFNVTIKRVA